MRGTPVVVPHPCALVRDVLRGAVVVVIEDDASVRTAVKELLESVGLEVILYASAGAFLEADNPDTTSCLVLDVRLPEVSGIKLQEELSKAGVYVPIILISAYADVAMAVSAMKAGAVDFLTKPFRSQDLLDAVFTALARDSARRQMQQRQSILREHYESLSTRERQVITMVAAGKLNKQIATDLRLSEVTVKLHRANAMRKMRATSLAELVKMLEHFDHAVAPDRKTQWPLRLHNLARISLAGSSPVRRIRSA
jgi:FixJ family two-component response regulator